MTAAVTGGRPNHGWTPRAEALQQRRISVVRTGLLNRKPCSSVQASWARCPACASVSTPSAITDMPSLLLRPTVARTTVFDSTLSGRTRTKDWSILILSDGNRRR